MTRTVHFTPEARDQLDKLEVDISGAASPAVAARYVGVVACHYVPIRPERLSHGSD